MRNTWLKAIPRKDWKLNRSHKVCAKHFHDDDFIKSSTDSWKKRREFRKSAELQFIRLKCTAVPSIFPKLPNYFNSPLRSSRKTTFGTSSARLSLVNAEISKQNRDFLIQDCFHNFNSFKTKAKESLVSHGYVAAYGDEHVQFYFVRLNSDFSEAPKLCASVLVTTTLEIHAFTAGVPIPRAHYKHLLSDAGTLKSLTELSNVLAFCKTLQKHPLMKMETRKNT